MLAGVAPRRYGHLVSPVPEIDVDLGGPAATRWNEIAPMADRARELIAFYVRDLGGLGLFSPLLESLRPFIDAEQTVELEGVARVLELPLDEVLLANVYYEGIKHVLAGPSIGCTAFAIDSPRGPLLARNLDWTTANGLLASQTIVANFRRGSDIAYRTVTWPGFIGCLSGVARGRFAVTLNAVVSAEPARAAAPVTFTLRRALEEATTFESATQLLSDSPLAADCLLLVTGPEDGQGIVIERTPGRSARRPLGALPLVVTNDFRALRETGDTAGAEHSLTASSCGRFDRAVELVATSPPREADACLHILRDPRIQMGITVQQMVLSARTGEMWVHPR